MFCKSCTYDLAGAPEPRCPECGRAFDPANPRTYLRTLAWRRRRPWILAAAAILVLYAIAPRGYVKGVAVLNSGGTGGVCVCNHPDDITARHAVPKNGPHGDRLGMRAASPLRTASSSAW